VAERSLVIRLKQLTEAPEPIRERTPLWIAHLEARGCVVLR
jgi:ABC-type molybdenum transport system ATPase subunit/photorepair protein PhrA